MQKKQVEIEKILDIYNILDEFQYKLERDVVKCKHDMMHLPLKTLQML